MRKPTLADTVAAVVERAAFVISLVIFQSTGLDDAIRTPHFKAVDVRRVQIAADGRFALLALRFPCI